MEGAISLIYKQLEGGAKKRNLTFSVTETELLNMRHQQKGKCYYTGYPMEYGFVYFKEGNFSDKTKMQISCDRLDPAKGYIKGNIVFCCTLVNKMKNILNEQEFYNICKDIIKNKK
ncbi:MAG TPA: hypothetical protein PKD96_00295 [Candidatus Absconditabacterales bacterium]|nr:hypothetical protein [Candidatus Absconditabacterales bacterium]